MSKTNLMKLPSKHKHNFIAFEMQLRILLKNEADATATFREFSSELPCSSMLNEDEGKGEDE